MPRKATSTRRFTIRHLGFDRTVEEFTAPEWKRLEDAKPVIYGDGLTTVGYNHDPARGCEPMTVRVIATDDDPYVEEIEAAFDRHMDDPTSAEPMSVRLHNDNGDVLATRTLVRAVIQSQKYVPGNTGNHENGFVEVVVRFEDILKG